MVLKEFLFVFCLFVSSCVRESSDSVGLDRLFYLSTYIHIKGGCVGCICICSFICLLPRANIAYVKAPTQSDFPVCSDNWLCDGGSLTL